MTTYLRHPTFLIYGGFLWAIVNKQFLFTLEERWYNTWQLHHAMRDRIPGGHVRRWGGVGWGGVVGRGSSGGSGAWHDGAVAVVEQDARGWDEQMGSQCSIGLC
jgi:hypothetical protein